MKNFQTLIVAFIASLGVAIAQPGGGPGGPGDFDFGALLDECGCEMTFDEAPVCVSLTLDSLGADFVVVVPNACFADCLGGTIVGDGDCFPGDGPGDWDDDDDDEWGDWDDDDDDEWDDEDDDEWDDEDDDEWDDDDGDGGDDDGWGDWDDDNWDGDFPWDSLGGFGDFPWGDVFPGDSLLDGLGDMNLDSLLATYGCGCEISPLDEPVCVNVVTDLGVMVLPLPNACLADCLGLEVVGNGDCLPPLGGGDGPWGPGGCDGDTLSTDSLGGGFGGGNWNLDGVFENKNDGEFEFFGEPGVNRSGAIVGDDWGFEAFPTPATDRLRVVSTASVETVVIYNMGGAIVERREGLAQERFDLNVSALEAGNYILILKPAGGLHAQSLVFQVVR